MINIMTRTTTCYLFALIRIIIDQHTFLLVTIDGTRDDPTLLAEVRNHEDKVLFAVPLKASELRTR